MPLRLRTLPRSTVRMRGLTTWPSQVLGNDGIAVEKEGKTITVSIDPDFIPTAMGLQGPPGEQGEQGEKGEKGDPGEQGPPGESAASVLARIYHGKDYGVIGDGTTDDTAAIQDLIDAVAAQGGGIAQLYYGDHKISASLVMHTAVILQGMGWGPDWGSMGSIHVDPTKYGTRLSWYGAATNSEMVSFGVVGATACIHSAVLRDIHLDGRRAAPFTNNMVRGVRFCGSYNGTLEFVSITNVGQAIALIPDTTLCVENCFDHIRIHKCYEGFFFMGAGDDASGLPAVGNSVGRDIIIWWPQYAGFEFYQWCDNNRFDGTFIQVDNPDGYGILVNPTGATNNGCSVITFTNAILSKAAGGSGYALYVKNTHGTPFTFNGNCIGPTEITYAAGAIVNMTNRGFPTHQIIWVPIHAGAATVGTAGTSYVGLHAGACAYFTLADYIYGSSLPGYTLPERAQIFAQQLKQVVWYTHWHTGSSSGSILLSDGDSTIDIASDTPGSTLSQHFSEIDITSFVLDPAPGGSAGNSWLFGSNRRAYISTRGDGTTAPTIYKSFLKLYFNAAG